MNLRILSEYIFLALAWGFSLYVAFQTVQAFGWVGAATGRALIASVALGLVSLVSRRKFKLNGAGLVSFLIVGATTVTGQLLGLNFAMPRIGTAATAIIVATIPLFSMLLSEIFGVEKLTLPRVVGLVFGLVGIVMLVGFPATPITPDFLLGCGTALFGALCAAFGSNYVRLKLDGVGSIEVAALAFLFGALLTLPLLIAVPIPTTPRPIDFGYLLIAGCVMSAMTYSLYFRLIGEIGPTRAISVEFLVTLVAVLVGAYVLGERLSPVQIGGMVVIIMGCVIVLDLFSSKSPPDDHAGLAQPH